MSTLSELLAIRSSRLRSVFIKSLRRFVTPGILLLGSAFAANADTSAVTATPLMDEFKHFVSSPPALDEVVYRTITAGDPVKGIPEGEGACRTNDWVYYFHARWQPGCLYVKSGTNLNVIENGRHFPEEIVSKFHDDYWRLDRLGILTEWHDDAHNLTEITLQPTEVFLMRTHQFAELMSMGVLQVDIGTVTFRGNALQAKGYVPEWKTSVDIAGELRSTLEGLPAELAVHYRSRAGVFDYVTRYLYPGQTKLPFLPRSFQSFQVLEGREIKLMECTLFSVKLASTPMPRSDFNLEAQVGLQDREKPKILFTNGTWYARNLVGGWAPIVDRSGRVSGFKHLGKRLNPPYGYFGGCALITGAALFLLFKARQPRKHPG